MQEKQSYESKKKALADVLAQAEKSLNRNTSNEFIDRDRIPDNRRDRDRQPNRGLNDRYGKRESLFKRPDLPISRCLHTRRLPDYEKNPQKWKRYSLSDVSDTSDRMNTTAAFNFLRQIEDQKQKNNEEEMEDANQKIVFKKSVKLRPKPDEIDPQLESKKMKGNKLVMPEYVIGAKRQTKKPKNSDRGESSRPSTSTKNLNLSHLNYDDDEEDE